VVFFIESQMLEFEPGMLAEDLVLNSFELFKYETVHGISTR
jgi:hypothetical protein